MRGEQIANEGTPTFTCPLHSLISTLERGKTRWPSLSASTHLGTSLACLRFALRLESSAA
eukprot:m.80435 g.80435  ORF g.80435 m.80435 type:complete len:60 (+) comp12599_c0_seq3:332-511(+)